MGIDLGRKDALRFFPRLKSGFRVMRIVPPKLLDSPRMDTDFTRMHTDRKYVRLIG
jgi:hypothetical protein